jgi:hypothetical protein
MICKKCGSENVNVQMVSETRLKKKHSIIYWILIGWWLELIMWLFLTIPMLIYKLFKPKNYKTKTSHHSMFVCQDYGYNWKA